MYVHIYPLIHPSHYKQGNPQADEAGGRLTRAVPAGQRRRLPARGRPAVHLRARGAADGHVPLQVPPHAPDPHVQGQTEQKERKEKKTRGHICLISSWLESLMSPC